MLWITVLVWITAWPLLFAVWAPYMLARWVWGDGDA